MDPKDDIDVIILGSRGCGKSSLINHLLGGKFGEIPVISPSSSPLSNAAVFYDKVIFGTGKSFNFKICDTSSQANTPLPFVTKVLLPMYCRSSKAAIVCFSITGGESGFEQVKQTLRELKESGNNQIIIMAGTMADLNQERTIPYDEAQSFAKFHEIDYMETSAKTGSNVNELFLRLGALVTESQSSAEPLLKELTKGFGEKFMARENSLGNYANEEVSPSVDEIAERVAPDPENFYSGDSSSVESSRASQPQWKRDEEARFCTECNQAFSMLIRKHHCRACGNIFCRRCSTHKTTLPSIGFNSPQRVCDACFAKFQNP